MKLHTGECPFTSMIVNTGACNGSVPSCDKPSVGLMLIDIYALIWCWYTSMDSNSLWYSLFSYPFADSNGQHPIRKCHLWFAKKEIWQLHAFHPMINKLLLLYIFNSITFKLTTATNAGCFCHSTVFIKIHLTYLVLAWNFRVQWFTDT